MNRARRWLDSAAVALGAAMVACATPPAPHTTAPARAATTIAPNPSSSSERVSAGSVSLDASASDATTAKCAAAHYTVVHISPEPIASFAFGKARHVAVLNGRKTLLLDGTAWHSVLPDFDAGARLSLFFGRDNEPRAMGTVDSGGRSRSVYLRREAGRWVDGSSELGPLGNASGALYGVLGHEDPEVVCVAARSCIVKRTTGWTNASAPAESSRIVVSGGRAWALGVKHIQEQVDHDWTDIAPPHEWDEPDAVWADTADALWVVEGKRDALWRRRDASWERFAAPVRRPRSIWGTSGTDIWLAGDGGAAHFNGLSWHCLPEIRNVAFVKGDGSEVWLAGESGTWRVN